jgi:hypothetical protein
MLFDIQQHKLMKINSPDCRLMRYNTVLSFEWVEKFPQIMPVSSSGKE